MVYLQANWVKSCTFLNIINIGEGHLSFSLLVPAAGCVFVILKISAFVNKQNSGSQTDSGMGVPVTLG